MRPRTLGIEDLAEALEGAGRLRRRPATTIPRLFLDTFDWRLYRKGYALEAQDGQAGAWLLWRELSGAPVSRTRSRAPRFAWDLPEGPLRRQLEVIVEMRALLHVAAVRSHSEALELIDGEEKVLSRVFVEEHAVDVPHAATLRPLPPRIRVEPVRGYDEVSHRVLETMRARLSLLPANDDVLEAALAALGVRPSDHSTKVRVDLRPELAAGEAARLILLRLLETMLDNEAGTRADVDSEFLHDFRVAVRRTRSALGQIKGVLPPTALQRFRPEFAWLGSITTPTRDLDVQLLDFPRYQAALPLPFRGDLEPLRALIEARKHRAQERLARALGSRRYRTLIRGWRSYLESPPRASAGARAADLPVRQVADERIRKVFRRALKEGRSLDDRSPPESLHELRKTCKKLRYLMEFFQSLYPSGELRPVVDALKVLQDNLGEFQDLQVQSEALQRLSGELAASPQTHLAMGMLVEKLLNRQLQVRREFSDAFRTFADPTGYQHFGGLLPGSKSGGRPTMKVLASYNIKGGVGKTAAAVNLAYLAAQEGSRTLVWDLDPQGAATYYFRVKPKVKGGTRKLLRKDSDLGPRIRGTDFPQLDLLPSDFSYRHMDIVLDEAKKPWRRLAKLLEPLTDEYDYVFLDCPPSVSLLSEAVFGAADALLVPIIPTTLSLRTLDQVFAFRRDNGFDRVAVLPFFSLVDRRKKLHRQILEELPVARPEVLRTQIPYASDVEQMGIKREPLACYASRGSSARAYAALWQEVLERLDDDDRL